GAVGKPTGGAGGWLAAARRDRGRGAPRPRPAAAAAPRKPTTGQLDEAARSPARRRGPAPRAGRRHRAGSPRAPHRDDPTALRRAGTPRGARVDGSTRGGLARTAAPGRPVGRRRSGAGGLHFTCRRELGGGKQGREQRITQGMPPAEDGAGAAEPGRRRISSSAGRVAGTGGAAVAAVATGAWAER